MNQSGLREKGMGTRRIKHTGVVDNFTCVNDLKETRKNPEEWYIAIGPCKDMPQMEIGE